MMLKGEGRSVSPSVHPVIALNKLFDQGFRPPGSLITNYNAFCKSCKIKFAFRGRHLKNCFCCSVVGTLFVMRWVGSLNLCGSMARWGLMSCDVAGISFATCQVLIDC